MKNLLRLIGISGAPKYLAAAWATDPSKVPYFQP
jgi:hypothetical protein